MHSAKVFIEKEKLLETFPRASSSEQFERASNCSKMLGITRNPLERATVRKCSELLENCSVLQIAPSHIAHNTRIRTRAYWPGAPRHAECGSTDLPTFWWPSPA